MSHGMQQNPPTCSQKCQMTIHCELSLVVNLYSVSVL